MSTIGFERRFNKAFQIDDRDEFVPYMLARHSNPTAQRSRDSSHQPGITGKL